MGALVFESDWAREELERYRAWCLHGEGRTVESTSILWGRPEHRNVPLEAPTAVELARVDGNDTPFNWTTGPMLLDMFGMKMGLLSKAMGGKPSTTQLYEWRKRPDMLNITEDFQGRGAFLVAALSIAACESHYLPGRSLFSTPRGGKYYDLCKRVYLMTHPGKESQFSEALAAIGWDEAARLRSLCLRAVDYLDGDGLEALRPLLAVLVRDHPDPRGTSFDWEDGYWHEHLKERDPYIGGAEEDRADNPHEWALADNILWLEGALKDYPKDPAPGWHDLPRDATWEWPKFEREPDDEGED